MSEQEQIERLTALARKIDQTAEVDIGEEHACVTYRPMRGVTGRMVNIDAWPRAADALEAALCVLADEPYSVRLDACKKDCEGYWEQHKRADAAEAEVKRLRAGVEMLAEGFERDAKLHEADIGGEYTDGQFAAYEDCARMARVLLESKP